MRTQSNIQLKRNEISIKIGELSDMENLSDSRHAKLRQKLIAELHTLDWILGKQKNIDSDEWFNKLGKED